MKPNALLLATPGILSTYLLHTYSQLYNIHTLTLVYKSCPADTLEYKMLLNLASVYNIPSLNVSLQSMFGLLTPFGKNFVYCQTLSKNDINDAFYSFILFYAILYTTMLNKANIIISGVYKHSSSNIKPILNILSNYATLLNPNISFITPFIDMDLKQAYLTVKQHNIPINLTMSCVNNMSVGCRYCIKCTTKNEIFN